MGGGRRHIPGPISGPKLARLLNGSSGGLPPFTADLPQFSGAGRSLNWRYFD